jgi:hypothetical protein
MTPLRIRWTIPLSTFKKFNFFSQKCNLNIQAFKSKKSAFFIFYLQIAAKVKRAKLQ